VFLSSGSGTSLKTHAGFLFLAAIAAAALAIVFFFMPETRSGSRPS
jgi:hypothetical protein